jgi:large subunit ribosomal protein L21
MYAVMKTGGKQYRVEPGQTLRVEKVEAEEGSTVRFDQVLMVGGAETAIGSPLLAGAAVEAEVVAQVKGDKVISFVRRRRKHSSKRTRGHRQRLTMLRITGIQPSEGAEMVRAAAVDAAAADISLDAEAADAGDDAALEAGDKPQFLDAPRKGGADDLTRIKGVGPKLSGILHEIGVFHFDQIAAWSDDEVAYMDARLSFKGRIAREGWIEQAARLAGGSGEPAAEDPADAVGASDDGASAVEAPEDATDGASEVEATPEADAPAETAEAGASEAEATPAAETEAGSDAGGKPETKE